MRDATLLIALVGCGRIGFAPTGPANGDGPDAGGGFDLVAACDQLVLRGQAACRDGELSLNEGNAHATGWAWRALPLATTGLSFHAELAVHLTGPAGSDGMTFVLQGDPRGTQVDADSGGYLGYRGISPSVAVELDASFDPGGDIQDPSGNHVGIDRDGSLISIVTADPGFPLDRTRYFVWVDYDGSRGELSVTGSLDDAKPATPLLAVAEDLTRLGSVAWMGVSAATGALPDPHRLSRWEVEASH